MKYPAKSNCFSALMMLLSIFMIVDCSYAQSLGTENSSQSSYILSNGGVLYTCGNNDHSQLATDSSSIKNKLITPAFSGSGILSYKLLYKQVDTTKLYLTVYPSVNQQKKAPAIVFFFGGGWIKGTIAQFEPHARYFAQRGLTSILVDYRVSSRNNTTPFDAMDDARDAMTYIVNHADTIGIDKSDIVVSGGSAGGQLALMCAFVPKTIPDFHAKAMVLFNPVINTGPDGYGYDRIGSNYKELSPVDNIPDNPPPGILFYGTDDNIIPQSQARAFCDSLEAKGGVCDLEFYSGQGHGFWNYSNTVYFVDTIKQADLFLIREGILQGEPDIDQWMKNQGYSLTSQDTLGRVSFPGGVTGWEMVSAGIAQALAIGNDGNLYAWGKSGGGRLGVNDTSDIKIPEKIPLPAGVKSWKMVAAGSYHTLAIASDGNLYASGNGGQGQLGLGDFNGRTSFTKVSLPAGVSGWVDIAAGLAHSLAIGDDGNLYTWGYGGAGRLGIGNTDKYDTPQLVSKPAGVTKWIAVAAEGYASLALGNDGNLYAFGHNGQGELGVNSTVNKLVPTKVVKPSGVSRWTEVAGGTFHALAIGNDGNLYSWGMNNYGQLGIGTTENDSIPVLVPKPAGVTGWRDIAAGNGHSLAIGSNDNVYAWGLNEYGELGTGNRYEHDSPVMVTGMINTAISHKRNNLPSKFELKQNFPNPYNPTTEIRYQLKVESHVILTVYDITGRRVARLVNQKQGPGLHEVTFNAINLASGLYFYRLEAGNYSETRKMILLK